MEQSDKASAEYWSAVWTNTPLNPAINTADQSARNHPVLRLHEVFKEQLSSLSPENKSLIEIGCGNSAWLSYFAINFGMRVSGIDYSKEGCQQSEKILERDGVSGTVYFGDFFNPPPEVPKDFDFVYSGGVVEHFEDTVGAIKAFAGFLKPGGVMITSLPNMTGLQAWFQKTFNSPVYKIHVPLTKKDIVEAHLHAGLEVLHAQYYSSVSLYINLEKVDAKPVRMLRVKKILSGALSVLSLGIWKLESVLGNLPSSRYFSPGIIVIAKKISRKEPTRKTDIV